VGDDPAKAGEEMNGGQWRYLPGSKSRAEKIADVWGYLRSLPMGTQKGRSQFFYGSDFLSFLLGDAPRPVSPRRSYGRYEGLTAGDVKEVQRKIRRVVEGPSPSRQLEINPAGFRHERLHPPGQFDRRSFRVLTQGAHRVIVGCPKGKWDPRLKACKVGTVAQAILHPKDERTRAAKPARRKRSQTNPPRGRQVLIYSTGKIVGTFYGRHRNRGKYKHKFGGACKAIYGLPDGSIRIKAHRGRLWEMR
jgi:hypothetical protein